MSGNELLLGVDIIPMSTKGAFARSSGEVVANAERSEPRVDGARRRRRPVRGERDGHPSEGDVLGRDKEDYGGGRQNAS